jgi:hypothetical protein
MGLASVGIPLRSHLKRSGRGQLLLDLGLKARS